MFGGCNSEHIQDPDIRKVEFHPRMLAADPEKQRQRAVRRKTGAFFGESYLLQFDPSDRALIGRRHKHPPNHRWLGTMETTATRMRKLWRLRPWSQCIASRPDDRPRGCSDLEPSRSHRVRPLPTRCAGRSLR